MGLLQLLISIPAVVLLLATGLYLSIKLRWLQIFKLPLAFSLIIGKNSNNKLSSLAALFTIIGGNLGVGNISGTAVALKSGGPGFIIWMLIIIVMTTIIKYVTCYLSVEKRLKRSNKYIGGPITYLTEAFKTNKAPFLFMLIMIICSITVGNLVQINSLSIPMENFKIPPLAAGIFMALIFFVTVSLGFGSIIKIMSGIVPIMALSYLTLSSVVLFQFSHNIIPSMKLIFDNFLNFQSLKSGLILTFFIETFQIIQVGALRGIFATDIGLGLEGIVHSSINNKINEHDFKVKQGLITMISPFVVAIITCLTTMVLLVTGAWQLDMESTNICIAAFKSAMNSVYINYMIIAIMFCFSFTTIYTWFFCSQSTILYIFNNKNYTKLWSIIFAIIIPLGSIMQVQLLWSAADISISLMIIINTVAILILLPKHKEIFLTDYPENKAGVSIFVRIKKFIKYKLLLNLKF